MTREERSNKQECPHCHQGVLRREASRTCPRCLAGYKDDLPARLAAVERERDQLRNSLEACRNAGESIRDERDDARSRLAAALARIAAVEARQAELRAEVARYATTLASMRFSKYRNAEDWAWLNAEGIGRRLAALAASPTPTGPEPATTGPIGYLNADPLRSLSAEERQGFSEDVGPATPEPTEETPAAKCEHGFEGPHWDMYPDKLCAGPGGADPKETRE